MSKLTRRDFLRKGGLFAALLALPALAKAGARQVNAFAEEAAYVIATYGDMDGYYGGSPSFVEWLESDEVVPRIANTPCENCEEDYFFEGWWCEDCDQLGRRAKWLWRWA